MDFKKHPLPWRVGHEINDSKIPRKGKRLEYANQVFDSLGRCVERCATEGQASSLVHTANSTDPTWVAQQEAQRRKYEAWIKANPPPPPSPPPTPEQLEKRKRMVEAEAAAIRAMMANPAKKKPT